MQSSGLLMFLNILLLQCAIRRALSLGLSILVFEGGSAHMQINDLDPKVEWIVVKCQDWVKRLPVKEHLSSYRGRTIFRSHFGKLKKSSQPIQCCTFIPNYDLVIPLEAIFFRGKLSEKPELPDELEYPPVEVVGFESAHYEFSQEPLLKNEVYEKMVSRNRHGLNEAVRQACLEMKSHMNVQVYVTLTTSPSRLRSLHYVLRSLDLALVDNIFISIPRKFRNSENYQIPSGLQEEFPKIVYLSESNDYGPIMKIVTAVQFVHETSDDYDEAQQAVFISIDDDHRYTQRTIDTLLYFSLMNPDAVISAATWNIFSELVFGIPVFDEYEIRAGMGSEIGIQVEGFAGVAYRGGHVDYKLMKYLSDRKRDNDLTPCYFSDDIVITASLRLFNIPIIQIPVENNEFFYTRHHRADMPHFNDTNALHLTGVNGDIRAKNCHMEKYEACYAALMSYYLDLKSPNLAIKDIKMYD